MKKFLAVLFSVMLVLALASCGKGTTSTESSSSAAAVSSAAESASSEQSTVAGENDKEWQKFIKEYEAWVDEYIELLQKVSSNPTDTSLLTEFTEMSDEVTQWEERATKITSELEPSSEEALEYANELLRIAQKLTDAVSSMDA